MEFKSFPEIKKLGSTEFSITQKIHGSNAQVMIVPLDDDVACFRIANKDGAVIRVNGQYYDYRIGSRTRWIVPGDDNYGFAQFVYANIEEFVNKLGPGQHFGEWAGPGINSGEGLKEKTFVLFDYWRYNPENLPPQTVLVPVLYKGDFDLAQLKNVMENLKTNGSKLAPGFMRPEGVVVQIKGVRYKAVFDAEETQWTKSGGVKAPKVAGPDYSHLMQPIRLEKLLSKDERYLTNYPTSLKDIAFAYLDDLIKEGQITGTEHEINGIKKQACGQVFSFVKESLKNIGGI